MPGRGRGDGARDHRCDHRHVGDERADELRVIRRARGPEEACAEQARHRDHRERRHEEGAGGAAVPGEADHVGDVREEERGQPGDEPIGREHQEDVTGE